MIKITLRNYRGYTNKSPAEFIIDKGFTSFIGKNNAGKSTCLRAMYELREAFKIPSIWTAKDVRMRINVQSEPDVSALINYDENEFAYISIEVDAEVKSQVSVVTKSTIRLSNTGLAEFVSIEAKTARGELVKPAFPAANVRQIVMDHGRAYEYTIQSGQQIVLDCMELESSLDILSRSVYFGPYRNAINEGGAKHYDVSVGTSLIEEWDYWKAGVNVANRRAISRVEADIQRLLGYQSLQINASSDNKTFNVSVNNHPFKLADLGAGVAELIITLSTALIKAPPYIFIDEPESHLHPSLQVDFLTTLASYASVGVGFSTHSIGLARSVSERIYAITKDEKTSKCDLYEKAPHLAELLGSLSYSGYFPLENTYVLLVEGATEVRLFQILLRKLKKDHSYVILPLGGSQLISQNRAIELAEVVRIAGAADKIFAIVDSEKKNAQEDLSVERLAFLTTCKELKINCLITERRATENYFSLDAVQSVLGPSFTALSEYELLKNARNGWAKSDNWKIANAENSEFFTRHDLGVFLSNLPSS